MSSEHSLLESSHSTAPEAMLFGSGDQIDLHTSRLEPIEVIRARQAITAAIAATASSNLEVQPAPTKIEKIPPQKAIANITLHILAMRKDHGANTIDLFAQDRAIETELFHTPAQIQPTDTQRNFDIAA